MAPTLAKSFLKLILGLMLIVLLVSPPHGATGQVHADAGDIVRVSVSSNGEQADGYSRAADVSDDGRLIVFYSEADNLVAGDVNNVEDVFLHDRQTGKTSLISITSSGAQANGGSYYAAISGDGRFVAFLSDATNLVSGDTNGVSDIFVHDRQTGMTTRVSVSSAGKQANDLSDSFVSISADGRFVAFNSDASNLVAGDTNGVADVFVRDRLMGVTERVSLDSDELQGNARSSNPTISADSRFVAFSSHATNLVSEDTNTSPDIFVRDRQTGATVRVSVNSSGVEADHGGSDPSISGDGRYVAFSSEATNMLDEEAYGYPHVYVHDRQTGTTTLASITSDGYQMVGWSEMPDISSDGRYIAFEFDDRGDGMPFREIYIHDRIMGNTAPVSGGRPEDLSNWPAISADGRYIAFSSTSSRLVPNDTNGATDVFLRELAIVSPTTVTYPSTGAYDGWVIESAEDSEVGSRIDATASTFLLGDANNDQQYRSVLHFPTGSLPNNAVITNVTLKIRRQGLIGDNPFSTLGNILVDLRKPHFDTSEELQSSDFQAQADDNAIGVIQQAQGAVWYSAVLDPASYSSINLIGTTQFRLRFEVEDNDDHEQDAMKFYSGNADPADQPVLTIEYYWTSAGSPKVVGISAVDTNPTSEAVVHYTVAFSEPVTGVDPSDFVLTTTGSISGASINGISSSGDTYTISVGTGTGSGTLRLDIQDDDSIRDTNNNPLSRIGTGNGNFSDGESYTINREKEADTVGVFRPSNGMIFLKNSNASGFADVALNYGLAGDKPVVGDWDGDGDDTIGVYRGNTFLLRNSNTVGFADLNFAFGQAGDQPIAGDWDGDGDDTIGVYRSSTAQFLLRNSNTTGPADISFYLGNRGDVAIAGDWNGDGIDNIGVFRPSNGIIYLKVSSSGAFAEASLNYGLPGDIPVAGDWDNNGIATIGVYRSNRFYLRNSNTNGYANLVLDLGIPGDMPIAGNWDGMP